MSDNEAYERLAKYVELTYSILKDKYPQVKWENYEHHQGQPPISAAVYANENLSSELIEAYQKTDGFSINFTADVEDSLNLKTHLEPLDVLLRRFEFKIKKYHPNTKL
ncbi:MAG: hypothetical protein MJZ34_13880 [Paludibacteraceae bacterium]|nr:hypothetical protein [Paludibacteraceae bacterium]